MHTASWSLRLWLKYSLKITRSGKSRKQLRLKNTKFSGSFFLKKLYCKHKFVLRDVIETHRNYSFCKSHFLKKKFSLEDRENWREGYRERHWLIQQAVHCEHDFVLFLCPPPLRERESGGKSKSSSMEKMSHGRSLLSEMILVLSATLQEKCHCCFAGISSSALNANWARFPFTSGKKTPQYIVLLQHSVSLIFRVLVKREGYYCSLPIYLFL